MNVMDPFFADNQLNVWLQARDARVFIGRTVAAGPPPAGWSDHFLAVQHLELEVEKDLCPTNEVARTVALDVGVVEGSRIADTKPGLASWLTTPGARAVWMVRGGQLVDMDTGAWPADAGTEAWIAAHCGGDVPVGVPGVLQMLLAATERESQLAAIFGAAPTSVVDVGGARLTVHQGKLRVFTGVRYQRVAGSRAADVVYGADAAELALALTRPGHTLPVRQGAAPEVDAALQRAAALLATRPDLAGPIRRAGGLADP